jgi:hypothetical protein
MQGNEDGTWERKEKGSSTGEARGLCMNGEISLISLPDRPLANFAPRKIGELQLRCVLRSRPDVYRVRGNLR